MGGKTIHLTKRWHYVLASALIGIFLLGASVASIVCWAVIYKPFDEFVDIKMQAVYGENIKKLNHYDYVWYYEVDGIVYEKYGRRNRNWDWPDELIMSYLKADPNYTVMNRNIMLILLPCISIVVILLYALILRVCVRDVKKLYSNDKSHIQKYF